MLKVVHVKVQVSNKTKTNVPLYVIAEQSISNFLKINNLNKKDVTNIHIEYDPVTRKYDVAIQFKV